MCVLKRAQQTSGWPNRTTDRIAVPLKEPRRCQTCWLQPKSIAPLSPDLSSPRLQTPTVGPFLSDHLSPPPPPSIRTQRMDSSSSVVFVIQESCYLVTQNASLHPLSFSPSPKHLHEDDQSRSRSFSVSCGFLCIFCTDLNSVSVFFSSLSAEEIIMIS